MARYDLVCKNGHEWMNVIHSVYEGHGQCKTCQEPLETNWSTWQSDSFGDEIDIEVRHGLCWADGTPRRFRSMKELRQVAHEKGLTIYGETPRPNYEKLDREASRKQRA